MKIFLFESESFQGSLHDQGPEKYQDDRQSSLCNISLSTVILWSHENTFCAKKAKIKIWFHIFISTVSLVDVRSRQYMTIERGGASADPDPAWWRWTHGMCSTSSHWIWIRIRIRACATTRLRHVLSWTSWYFSGRWSCKDPCCLWEGQRALRFKQKYLHLCSDERRSYGFGMTWGWVINDRIFIFGWTIPLS